MYSDSTTGEILYGFKQNEEPKIKAKYLNSYTDTLHKMAIVQDRQKGWIGINKNDSIILFPYIYDNGPDYLSEGLFRFVEDDKMGFANADGEKIIPAHFDFLTSFKDGIAKYYIGGELIDENGKSRNQIIKEQGEGGLMDKHWTWGGNITKSGYLDKMGNQIK